MVGLKNGHKRNKSQTAPPPPLPLAPSTPKVEFQRRSWELSRRKTSASRVMDLDLFPGPVILLSYLSHSLVDRWCTTVDFITSFLHFSRFSAFRSMTFHPRSSHPLILSYLILSYLIYPVVWMTRWGTTVDFTTSFLHSSRFSAFRSVMFH